MGNKEHCTAAAVFRINAFKAAETQNLTKIAPKTVFLRGNWVWAEILAQIC